MKRNLVVTNKHGARFTVVGVESVASADGDVWCVRLRDSDRCVCSIPMDAFAANFSKVKS
jgi:hypothetical protein